MRVAPWTDDYSVLTQTRDVLAYHRDPELPGRPVSLLLGGAFVAMVSLALLGALAYRAWYLHEVDTDRAWYGVSFLFVIYVFGVFVFSYAYALYDIGKAVRLTAVVAFISVVAIFVVIGALALLSKAKQGVSLLEGKEGTAYTIGGLIVPDEDDEFVASAEDDGLPPMQPFAITCSGCGARFAPSPPQAVCPYCGRAALAAGQ